MSDDEIIFIYAPREYTITIKHETESGENLFDTSETHKYGEEYNYAAHDDLLEHYTVVVPDNASGTVDGDMIITFVYVPREYSVVTLHRADWGRNESLVDDVVEAYKYGDTYSTSPASSLITNYTYRVSDQNDAASGDVDGNKTVIYYYKKKTANITIRHLDEDGNELIPTITETKDYGDSYGYLPDRDLQYHYTATTPNNNTGTVSGDIEITFVYAPREFTVVTFHRSVEGRNEEISARVTNTYKYGEEYTTKPADALIDAYDYTIAESENDFPASGTVYGDTFVTYYYSKKKFTLTVHHKYEDGSEYAEDDKSIHEYGDEYTTSAKDVDDGWYVEMPDENLAEGTITSDIEITYVYKKKEVPSAIEDNNEISSPKTEDDILTCLILMGAFTIVLSGVIFVFKRKEVR